MKCILKSREGHGAKVFYYEERNDDKFVDIYRDEKLKNKILVCDKNNIIPIKEDIKLVRFYDDLFLPPDEFDKIRNIFFGP